MDSYIEYGLSLIKYDMRYLSDADLILAYRAHLMAYFNNGLIEAWDHFIWRLNEALGKHRAYRIGWMGYDAVNTKPESLQWYLLLGDPYVIDAASKAEQFAREPDWLILNILRNFKGTPVVWEALTMFMDPIRLTSIETAIQLEKMAYTGSIETSIQIEKMAYTGSLEALD